MRTFVNDEITPHIKYAIIHQQGGSWERSKRRKKCLADAAIGSLKEDYTNDITVRRQTDGRAFLTFMLDCKDWKGWVHTAEDRCLEVRTSMYSSHCGRLLYNNLYNLYIIFT